MNAEQWLADVEAKADAATQGTWKADGGLMSPSAIFADDKCIAQFLTDTDAEYLVAANPEAIKRLVAMVNILSEEIVEAHGKTPQGKFLSAPVDILFPYANTQKQAAITWIDAAYERTEPKP